MAVRNGKWNCATALVGLQDYHPLNPRSQVAGTPTAPLTMHAERTHALAQPATVS